MQDTVFTVYKLIILYMLDRAEGEVTQGMLSTFLLEGGYANFVSLAESYDQLEKQGLVNIILRGNKKFLKLTEAGQQALGFFGMQLSPQIRRQADNWLIENGQKIREEREVTAIYERMTSGGDLYHIGNSRCERKGCHPAGGEAFCPGCRVRRGDRSPLGGEKRGYLSISD